MTPIEEILPKLVDELLDISEWPWIEEEGGFIYSREATIICQAFTPNGTDAESNFIVQSPVRLARMVVALVEERAGKPDPSLKMTYLVYITNACKSFHLDSSKFEKLKARLKEARDDSRD